MQPVKQERTKSGCFFKCPYCHRKFRVPSVKSHRKADHSSANCYYCDGLVLFVKGKAKKFHRELNKDYPRWPKDGKGTGCITF